MAINTDDEVSIIPAEYVLNVNARFSTMSPSDALDYSLALLNNKRLNSEHRVC